MQSSPSGSSPSSGALIRGRKAVPMMRSGDGWKKLPELKVKVSQLRSNEARLVYEALKDYGNILSIDVVRVGAGYGAYVVFR